MGKSNVTGKVINWPWRTISTLAFLWKPLQMSGCGLDSGIVLLTDDCRYAKQLANCLEVSTDAKIYPLLKKKHLIQPNYVAGVNVYKNGYAEVDLNCFLEGKDFLPVLIVGGILPICLKDAAYIFRVTQADMEAVSVSEFKNIFSEFKEFAISHIPELQKMFQQLDSSASMTEVSVEPEFKLLHKNLLAVGEAWRLFNREKLNEASTNRIFTAFVKESLYRISEIPQFSDDYELEQTFRELVWQYIGTRTDILIADIEEVDGMVENAIGEEKCVLFDWNFYFMPEKMVKTICNPILGTVSVDELKVMLKNQKILDCNVNGYTVKKEYVNIFGVKKRIRVMKVRKELLMSDEQMMLEDLYGYKANIQSGSMLMKVQEERQNV